MSATWWRRGSERWKTPLVTAECSTWVAAARRRSTSWPTWPSPPGAARGATTPSGTPPAVRVSCAASPPTSPRHVLPFSGSRGHRSPTAWPRRCAGPLDKTRLADPCGWGAGREIALGHSVRSPTPRCVRDELEIEDEVIARFQAVPHGPGSQHDRQVRRGVPGVGPRGCRLWRAAVRAAGAARLAGRQEVRLRRLHCLHAL